MFTFIHVLEKTLSNVHERNFSSEDKYFKP
jgi:hypothetical protein